MGTTYYFKYWSNEKEKAYGVNGIDIQENEILFSHDSCKECINLAREYNKKFECSGSGFTKLKLLLDAIELKLDKVEKEIEEGK